MNSYNSNWTTTNCTDSQTLSFTTDTSDGSMTLGVNDVWFPYYMESTWIPYCEEKYIPKWHITQGYKNQMKIMWND